MFLQLCSVKLMNQMEREAVYIKFLLFACWIDSRINTPCYYGAFFGKTGGGMIIIEKKQDTN
tara:strand:- start:75977 stop:76162 length:186 start_codon:yes stop_codon:yes gene_type:complete